MGLLTTIQQAIADRLKTDRFFSDIPILTEKIGDIENEIQRQLGAIGVVVIVITPTANVVYTAPPGPYWHDIHVVVRVVENVVINQGQNGTKKPASDIAEIISAMIHLYQPPPPVSALYCTPDHSLSLVADPSGNLTYDCDFTTHGGIIYTPT
jgi:hypothetical protein